jgi:hypothetical protein
MWIYTATSPYVFMALVKHRGNFTLPYPSTPGIPITKKKSKEIRNEGFLRSRPTFGIILRNLHLVCYA